MKKIYFFLLNFFVLIGFAQVPGNDVCTNATPIVLTGGQACINSTNLNATSDLFTNVCDNGTAGNEVWYTFIATNANNVVTITPNGATPANNLVVTLITSGCGSGSYNVCNSAVGAAPVSTTLGLVPGTQVLISVESNGTDGTYQVCINSTPPSSNPGDGCPQATLLCDKSPINFPSLAGFTASGTQPSCFDDLGPVPVRKDVWVKFTVGVTGTLEFIGTPLAGDEFDWALYNITAGCPGTEVSCNYSYASATVALACNAPGATFGMLPISQSSLEPCPDEFNTPINVTAGQTYALLIDNYDQTNGGFNLDFGGTFQMGTTAIFTVTPQSSCTVPVNVTITNSSVGATTYTWNYGDGSATTNATNPPVHTYTATGDYLISVVASGGGCTSVYSQRVNLNAGPIITMNPLTATVCPSGTVSLGATIALGKPTYDKTFTNTVNTAIPNNNAAGLTNTITVSGMLNPTIGLDMVQSICFTINHTLHDDIGWATANAVRVRVNGVNYNFTPLPLPAVTGTATYCFPQSVLNAIMAAGGNSNGPWVLKVADNWGPGGGTGSLISWSIVLRDLNAVTGYTWSPTATLTNTNTLNPIASPVANTVYSLTAIDAIGCPNTRTVAVTVGGPTVTVTNTTICSGSTVTLTASGTTSYSWSTGATTSTVAVSPTVTTVYTVTGTTGGCSDTKTVSVTVNTVSTTASTTGTLTCTNTTVTLNSTLAGMNYTWTAPGGGSLGSANSQSTTASGAAGTYTLKIQSGAGCTYSTTTSVTQNTTVPTVTVSATQTITCAAPTVTLIGSATPSTCTPVWTGGVTSGANSYTATAASPNSYTLTVTNPFNGCVNSAVTQVVPAAGIPSVTTSVTNSLSCTTLTAQVVATTTSSPVSYSWTGPGVTAGATTASATVNASGQYTVVVTNTVSSCSTTLTADVIQNITTPSVAGATSGTLTCTTLTVNASATTTTAPVSYNWTGTGITAGAATGTITVNQAGTFNYTVTNTSNGCVTTGSLAVAQNTTVPTLTVSATQTITCASPTVTLIGSATPSTCTPVWTGGVASGAASYTATATAANMYTLTVTNPANGCFNSAVSQVVSNVAVPAIASSVTNSLSCITLTAQVIASTTTTPVSYNWSGTGITAGSATGTITVNQAGTFNYTVTNTSNGCATTGSVAVTQNTTVPTVTVSPTQTITCAAPTVTLIGSATPSTCTPVWTGGVSSGSNSYTATASAPNMYTLTVTDPGNGCTNFATTQVVAAAGLPSVLTSVTNSLSCTALTAQVVATTTSSPVTYNWTGPGVTAGATTASATVNTGGQYTVVVTNTVSACSVTLTASVTQNTIAPSVAGATSGTLTCNTLTVNASATTTTTPVSYNWTGTGITAGAATGTITVNQSGTYNYTVTNTDNGCVTTGSQAVSQNTTAPTLTVSATQTITCAAPTVTLIGSATPSTCTPVWTGGVASGANSYTATATVANMYILTVTDPGNGCVNSATTQVVTSAAIPAVVSSVTNSLSCTTLTAQVVASTTTTPVSYNWTGPGIIAGAGTATITVDQPGTFDYTVTNTSNGCVTTGSVGVTQNTIAPIVTGATSGTLTCTVLTVNASASTTATPVSYNWVGTGITAGAGTGTITVNQPGTFDYTVTNTSNGCATAGSLTVTQNTVAPTLTVTASNPTICLSGTSTLTATGATTYTWSGSTVIPSNGSVVVAQPPVTETYTVNGSVGVCTSSAQIVVTVTTTPAIAITGNTIICSGSSTSLTASGASTYTWSPGATLTSTNTAGTNASPPSTQTYSVTGATAFGCSNSAMVIVTVIQTPTVTITPTGPSTICNGSSISLTANGASNYTWSPAASLTSTNTATTSASPVNTTNYTVIGTTGTGPFCTASSTVQIIVIPKTQAIAQPAQPICVGETSMLVATGGNVYSWIPTLNVFNPGDSVTLVQPLTTTVYTVTASKNGNCPGTATVVVTVHQLPIVNAGRDTVVNIDETITLHGTGIGVGNNGVGFVPTDGTPLECNFCPNLMVNPQVNTCYLLKGESAFGCVSYDEVCVEVTRDYNVYIPNAFTPNDDLVNEVFQPVGYGILEFKMSVYDRWGGLIFKSDDDHPGWDGKNKGVVCEEGIYVYQVEYKTMGGIKGKKTGHITIIPRVK